MSHRRLSLVFLMAVLFVPDVARALPFVPLPLQPAPKPAPKPAPTPTPTEDEGTKLKAEGDQQMVETNYTEALRLYAAAYEKSKNPALLYNQGRALMALNRLPEALDMIKRFDAEAPADLKAKVPALAELLTELEGRVSSLSVEVEGPNGPLVGATIKLGDRVLGKTPLGSVRVNAGKQTLETTFELYEVDTRSIDLEGKKQLDVKVQLKPRDKRGLLVVTSPTPGAIVTVDGKVVGQVPAEVRLDPGPHEVEVDASGYASTSTQVDVAIGATVKKDIELGAPFYETPWFWTIIGGTLVTGGTIGVIYAVTTEGDAEFGTISPGQVAVSVPSRLFGAPSSAGTVFIQSPALRF